MLIGVDVSGSVRRERLPAALDFITDVVDDLEVSADKTRVALVYFSDDAYELFDFTQFSNKEDIIYWIKKTPYIGGRTNSAAALRLMVIPPAHFTGRQQIPVLATVDLSVCVCLLQTGTVSRRNLHRRIAQGP